MHYRRPMNLIEQIKLSFTNFLIDHFSLSKEKIQSYTLSINSDEKKADFGDLNSNAPLILAKELKRKPTDIAKEIVAGFNHSYIEHIEIAGAGFINIFLNKKAWHELAQDLYKEKQSFFAGKQTDPKHYSIEFVSANPTGPLHFGHGRSGIIGDVLSNILRFLGHSATKEFYINDAGNQIQKLGQSFKVRCQQQLGIEAKLPEEGYFGEYLIDLAKECISEYGKEVLEKDASFFENYAKDILLDRIKETLLNYGISFDVWFSEKKLHTSGAIEKAIDQLQKNGHLYELDGALWFKSTNFGDDKDRVVRKSTGEWTYIAADIAYLLNKVDRGFNPLVLVLGHDHHSYAIRLEGIRQAFNLKQIALDTILYQLVRIKNEGELVRLSKRAGNIISLQDVIDSVGTDVARFFYLHRKADAHLEFDLALARARTEENPVYYIQYAYVRIGSIIQKASHDKNFSNINASDAVNLNTSEVMLLKKIISLKELLEQMSHNYHTHLLAYYSIELADLYHSYYSKYRIIELENIPQSRARLLLMHILQQTFSTVFDLLGISKPEKM